VAVAAEKVVATDILIIATPTWLGQPSSIAKRVLERMDALLSETKEDGRPIADDKLAGMVVTGNQDGAHHCIAEVWLIVAGTAGRALDPARDCEGTDTAATSECDTGATRAAMPTQRRRHAITETPPVQAALDELREELGDTARIEFGELVILGANEKVVRLRATRDETTARRRQLAERIRRRDLPVDRAAADEVRRAGWSRQ
jgi:hypothetical protein